MKKAVIYVSGKAREEQERFCREYAKYIGCDVIEATPDMEKTLTLDYDILLVFELKVITRNVFEKVVYTRKLKERNIELIIAKQGINYEAVSDLVADFLQMNLDDARLKRNRKNG